MRKIILSASALLAGLALISLLLFVYLRYGHVPVAVTDPAFPYEAAIVHVPLNARIDREAPHAAPFVGTPEALRAGAVVYRRQCAFCHGLPQQQSEIGKNMYPVAPQLWEPHGHGVVGVSDDPVGETYWKVKNGIRLAGMPAYAKILSEQEMWQVSLLMGAADKPLQQDVQLELHP